MCLHAQGVASNFILQAKTKITLYHRSKRAFVSRRILPPFLGTLKSPEKDLPAQVVTTALRREINTSSMVQNLLFISMSDVDAMLYLHVKTKSGDVF
jgi:hypothetical protein